MKTKSQFTTAELAEITAIQEKSNITRKAAVKKFQKSGRKIVLTATPAPVTDVKIKAANDDTNKGEASTAGAAAAPAKAKAAPKPPAPTTPAGDARKEGIRLFQLAGKPKKEDFIHVYGPMGAKWTWVARAKAVGLNTAEEAAAQFQKMRAGKPQQFVKAEPQPEKK
jgi:hypothetical protein